MKNCNALCSTLQPLDSGPKMGLFQSHKFCFFSLPTKLKKIRIRILQFDEWVGQASLPDLQVL